MKMKTCFFLKKRSSLGGNKIYRGISKKSGGIGLKLVKKNKRVFYPNLQKKKLIFNGIVRKLWISTKALKRFTF